MRQLITRLDKVEKAILPQQPDYPVILQTTATQAGLNGEVIYEETEEQAIQNHLAQHPEDAGREFKVICRVFVSPNNDNDTKYQRYHSINSFMTEHDQ